MKIIPLVLPTETATVTTASLRYLSNIEVKVNRVVRGIKNESESAPFLADVNLGHLYHTKAVK